MKFKNLLKYILWTKLIFLVIIAIIFVILFFNINSKAIDSENKRDKLKVNVTAGFQGQQAPEGWVPLTIEIENTGDSDFQGELKIEILKRDILAADNNIQTTSYKKIINIEKKRKKNFQTVILYEKDFFAIPHIKILRNNKIIYDKVLELDLKIDYSSNILIINQSGSGYDFLQKDKSGDSNRIYYLQPKHMSEDWLAYREMDLIILGRGDFSNLNRKQIDAIKYWVNQGNKIVISASGDFLSYNSQLINELSPYDYVKKEMIEVDNSLAEIWYLRDLKNNLLLKDGNLPQVIKVDKFGGKIICVALEPLVISKKEELYFNLLPEMEEKGYTDYAFLDKFFDEFAGNIEYQYPESIYLLLIFLIFIIFVVYLYQKVINGSSKISVFLVILIIFSLIFTSLFYITIGRKIINDNNILSEIAIIEMRQGSKRVFVESYFSFLSHFDSDTSYYINRDYGFLDGIFKKASLNKIKNFNLQNRKINIRKSEDEKWQTGQFRAYYRSELPLKYKLIDEEDKYIFVFENKTGLDIKYLSIFYNNQWFYANEIKIGEKENIDIEKNEISYRENRSRGFKETVNMDSYLSERVLNEVIKELTNYQVQLDERIIIFALVEGKGLEDSVKFEKEGKRLFSGVFYLPLDVKKLIAEEEK
ncbi:MAG: hypothetical protein ACQEQF_03110 [Bacillota bacterium]